MTDIEYGVPVIFDVTAPSREAAGAALVEVLASYKVPGNSIMLDGKESTVESWWTVEAVDKHLDRNDNDSGIVVFNDDLDYLLRLLETTAVAVASYDTDQHLRLMKYLQPENRIGWTDERDE